MLSRHPTIESLLGEPYARLLASEALFQEAIRRPELRLWCAVTSGRAGEEACWAAQQALGGYGYMRDYGLEHRLRDAKLLSLLIGNSRQLIQGALRRAWENRLPWP